MQLLDQNLLTHEFSGISDWNSRHMSDETAMFFSLVGQLVITGGMLYFAYLCMHLISLPMQKHLVCFLVCILPILHKFDIFQIGK